ncbi:MAG TPA: glycosyltransferase [Saprospiraceae bacterium]|nr:glycosyltransferase [Saprospiraceae bacterium]
MTQLPFISIIIPAKNEENLIRGCITSLNELDYPKEKFEILIVDGLSTDNTTGVAREMGASVINNAKQTVSPGRNIGFENARGDLIAFTDADCIVDKNWLSNSIKYFENDEAVACVGGPNLTPSDESDFGKAVGFVFDQPVFAAGSIHARELHEVKEVSSIPGCNAIYRQSILAKVMPLDESMLTGDDTLLNRKILNLGCRLLYTPDVKVFHYRRPTPAKLWRQFYRYAIGRLQVGKKDKRLLNMAHVLTGLSLPLGILIFILLLWSKSFLVLYCIMIIAILFFLYFSIKGMIRWKSPSVGLQVPLVIILIMTAWSCGFLREWMFPLPPALKEESVLPPAP